MKININVKNLDSELMFKNLDIRIGNKSFTTPEKASYKENSVSQINEIYKKFSINEGRSTKLEEILKSESYESKINNEIKRCMNSNINFLFVDYADTKIPDDTYIETLSDIQYVYSDAVITPSFSNIVRNMTGDELIDTYLEGTNKYLDVVETLNNKCILGNIPFKVPRLNIKDIFENYCNRDITSFVIDFDGKCVETTLPKMRMLMRLMKDYGLLEDSFLYGINSYEGKFAKNAVEIPAKDFISMGYGIDILGMNHIPPRMPSEAWKTQPKNEISYRLFDRNIYGYTKKTNEDLKKMGISNNHSDVKKFNNTEQCNETLSIRSLLQKESTLKGYLGSKSQVEEKTLSNIKKLHKDAFKS
ncbi:hypothetical protein MSBRW_1867 [Methanosarcina barkeri str. Wiesmoor]|uniref:Uncharacterized protein n=2 Tax=Methanosarcina barkeri TaxID=2208 RepID=A0A0E3QJT4_METBA|nr:hypothetical protein [Methanosarcina barkeri]AKB51120.1 hypothetical protein MSBRW_1867 [Methanosarcina barkeri str. Wiesmoor]